MIAVRRHWLGLLVIGLVTTLAGVMLLCGHAVMAAPTNQVLANTNLVNEANFYSWVKGDSTAKKYLAYYKPIPNTSNATLMFPYASGTEIPYTGMITSQFTHKKVDFVTGTAGSNAPAGNCTQDKQTEIEITVRSYRKTCTVSKTISPNTTVIYYISDIDSGSDNVSQDVYVSGLQGVYVATTTWLFKKADGTQKTIPERTANPNILSAHKTCEGETTSGKEQYRCAAGAIAASNSTGYFGIDWINRSADDTKGMFEFHFYPNEYRTLTFDPALGTIDDIDINGDGVVKNCYPIPTDSSLGCDNNLNRHYTVTLWEHSGGSNRLREYQKGAKVGYYPVPRRAGYTFTGWYDGSTNRQNGGDSDVNGRFLLDGDTTLTAHWSPNSYKITYYGNGNTGGSVSDNPVTATTGTTHTVKTNGFTRTNYRFTQWCTEAGGGGSCYDPSGTNKSFVVSGNVNLYAQWERIKYTITYNNNGGTGTMSSVTENSGDTHTVKANAFDHSEGEFVRWCVAANGTTPCYNPSAAFTVTSDVTLYAQWKIDYNLAPSTSVSPTGPVEYGTNLTYTNTIKNTGSTKKKNSRGAWHVFSFVVPAGNTVPTTGPDAKSTVGNSTSLPGGNEAAINAVYGAATGATRYTWLATSGLGVTNCSSSDQTQTYDAGATRTGCVTTQPAIPALNDGDRLCVAVWVIAYKYGVVDSSGGTSNDARYSVPACVTVKDWRLTAYTYSAVNPTSPTDNDLSDTTSSNKFNNSRKVAYPSYPTFGGHAAGAEDKVYYMVRLFRTNDGISGTVPFKYWPNWTFGSGLIAANSVNSGQLDVSALCPTGWSYDTSFKRCAKGSSPAIDFSLASNGTTYITTTADSRLWNNSLPSGKTLNDLKGQDICYIMSINRASRIDSARNLVDNDTSSRYWGSLEGSTENRCSVTVKSPWILEPKARNTITTGRAAVGDTYSITPSIESSQRSTNDSIHVALLVRVVGASNWSPAQGLNTMAGSADPSSLSSYGSGAANVTSLGNYTLTSNHFNNAGFTWTGSAIDQTFEEDWYGKKVCYYMVLSNATGWAYDKTNEYRYSSPTCVKWSKSPQIQMRGADSSAGGIWEGTTTERPGGFIGVSQSDERRGSWSQYGLIAYRGNTTYFGSAGYTANDTANRSKACSLMFANTVSGVACTSTARGGSLFGGSSLTKTIALPTEAKYTSEQIAALPTVPDVHWGTRYLINQGVTVKTLKLDNIPNGTYQIPPDTYIQDSRLRKGQWLMLVSTGGQVVVARGGVLPADTTFNSLNEIPVFTLIAQHILAQDSEDPTTQGSVFGTYINTSDDGTEGFSTCHTPTLTHVELRDGGFCRTQLRVDGAVISRTTPILHRTIGSGYSSANVTRTVTANGETHLEAITPAELFNYQPNLFLTPYVLQVTDAKNQSWVVTKQTILPARF